MLLRVSEKPQELRPIAQNRKARFSYHVLEELECGLALKGTEVKSLRAGQGSLAEAYARIVREELWLVGMHIPEYGHGNVHNHKPTRDRKLLAHRREIAKWHKAVKEKGVTLVPLEVYFRGSKVKVKIGLCKGKRLYDKRQVQKDRTDQRQIDRAMSRRR
jgi:SsrA-binding protein